MLQSVMLSRVFAIILLLWASVPNVAEAARLTLGAAPGVTHGLDSESQARRLAADLAKTLGDEVEVRLFADQQQLGQWLNQFAMIDLGLMDSAFLAEHPGKFLVLGPSGRDGRLFVVARQGATGDLPQKMATALRRSGSAPLPTPPPQVETSISTPMPPAPGSDFPAAPLVLGVVAGRDELIRNPSHAEQFAAMLGKRLGVPIRPRLFDNEQLLADWFNRFRMIDLAVIREPDRRDPLTGNYRPLQRLTAKAGRTGLLVVRQDLAEGRSEGIEQALAAYGRDLNLDDTLAAPMAELPTLAAAPAPIMPTLPQPPTWPEVPVVPPAPEKPEVAPAAPSVPPVPLVIAELQPSPEPVLDSADTAPLALPTTEVVEEVSDSAVPTEPAQTVLPIVPPTIEPEAPSPAVLLPPPSTVESFRLPKSIGPMGDVVERQEPLPVPADTPASSLPPESAAPIESVLSPSIAAKPLSTVVAEAPAPEAPILPTPPPVETVVVETVPDPLPELPFIPVPPRVIEEVPPTAAIPEVTVTAPEVASAAAAEVVSAAVAEAPAPETPVVPTSPSVETVVVETVPEASPELPFDPVPPRMVAESPPPAAAQEAAVAEESASIFSGVNEVPSVISQPDLPQELRPPGIPLPRPGRLPNAPLPAAEPLLLTKLQEPLPRTPKAPPLLPELDPEPGVVYIAPFITLMVPPEVQERVFDQFVDTLNQRGAARQLKFVILKQGLDKIDRTWLGARKYALGEIYGYVEDSGCCSTDLRTRVRLTYYRPREATPALTFEYPVRAFFDHDRSTLVLERQKLADQIASALVDELFKALQP